MHVSFDSKRMVAIYTINDVVFTFRAKNIVCPRCGGKGTHVNPSVDSHGVTKEEFDENPEFEEAYYAGVYDVVCEKCHGKNVVLTPDIDSFSQEEKEIWEIVEREMREEAIYLAQCLAERRMGA